MKEIHKNPFLRFAPPGHFYSPLPSLSELEEKKDEIWGRIPKEIPGIDFNIDQQLELIARFQIFYNERPFGEDKQEGLRYYYDNNFYPKGDANTLYCMIRYLEPGKIIEVGSGYSSAVILDTNELFFNNSISFKLIEPYPERLMSLIKEGDLEKAQFIQKNLQEVKLDKFLELEEKDILFIDSTHVSRVNSDVNYILFQVLPVLSSGVWIHFHDIFYPFEYPLHWFQEGRAWNEAYLVRAFLQYNSKFEIIFFHNYLTTFHKDYLMKKLPGFGGGVNLWIKKL